MHAIYSQTQNNTYTKMNQKTEAVVSSKGTVTEQLADTPTRGLPTRGLDNSQTGQLAD